MQLPDRNDISNCVKEGETPNENICGLSTVTSV
jgi:hypothetical protein